MIKKTFEEMLPVIDESIRSRKNKWTLKAVPSIDYDDVSQLIRIHIWEKWEQWDQTKPIGPWVNAIIVHQIYNLLRNLYTNHASPCLSCPANKGENICSLYGAIEETSCNLYATWAKRKKSAYQIKLPLPLENHIQEVHNIQENLFDIEPAILEFHKKMKSVLTPLEYKLYEAIYINHLSDEEAAKIMGYKTNEKNRLAGYRRIKQLQVKILEKAKKYSRL